MHSQLCRGQGFPHMCERSLGSSGTQWKVGNLRQKQEDRKVDRQGQVGLWRGQHSLEPQGWLPWTPGSGVPCRLADFLRPLGSLDHSVVLGNVAARVRLNLSDTASKVRSVAIFGCFR